MGNADSTSSAVATTTNHDESNLEGRKFSISHSHTVCVVDSILAQGGFSTVYSCNAHTIALKQIRIASTEAEMEALNEIRVHKSLGNDSVHIAPLLDHHIILSHKSNNNNNSKPSKEILLFFPLYTLGTLGSKLLEEKSSLKEECKMDLLFSCALAVETIHNKNVVHGDLKTINFMLHGPNQVVLIDFGSARLLSHVDISNKTQALDEQERAERMSSAAYRAPELWDISTPSVLDLRKCDVFALGCIFYASLYKPYGYTPFEHPTQGLLPLAARTGSVKRFQPRTSKTSSLLNKSPLDALVESMLHRDPTQRPLAGDVVKSLIRIREDDFDADF